MILKFLLMPSYGVFYYALKQLRNSLCLSFLSLTEITVVAMVTVV